jgi:hypothetical protein
LLDLHGLDVFIIIDRLQTTGRSTPGLISVTSNVVTTTFSGYTLELLPNQRIPAGTYSAYVRTHSVEGEAYDPHRIHLEDVPCMPGAQIHVGNVPGHTTGCILVGTTQGRDAVWDSTTAMEAILSIIEADATNSITVIIYDWDVTPGA